MLEAYLVKLLDDSLEEFLKNCKEESLEQFLKELSKTSMEHLEELLRELYSLQFYSSSQKSVGLKV